MGISLNTPRRWPSPDRLRPESGRSMWIDRVAEAVMGRVAVVAVLLPACVLLTVAPAQALVNNPSPPRGSATEILAPRWRGDLDGMIKRRQIRILVPYSKTFYFIDRGVQRGLSYALGELIEQDL